MIWNEIFLFSVCWNVTVCSNWTLFSLALLDFGFHCTAENREYISFHSILFRFYSRNVCVMTKKSIRGFGCFALLLLLLLLFCFLRISGSFNLQFSVWVAFYVRGFSLSRSLSHLHIFVHIICDNKCYVNVE